MSDWLIDALLELYGIIRAGHATQITSSIEDITGRKPLIFTVCQRLCQSSFIRECKLHHDFDNY
ncbi:MAG TPA: hypothetical protein VI146_01610, partial [Nitrososphaeraceae archaeon]